MMYLEERVRFLEDLIQRMFSDHPELCPHSFKLEYDDMDPERNIITSHYRCQLCGMLEDQEREIIGKIPHSFSF